MFARNRVSRYCHLLEILSYSSMLCIMGWDTIYISDQNCQRRALIIEKLTESKEQLFFFLFIVCCLRRLKAALCPVNTIISILKTLQAFLFWENMLDTKATATSVTRAKWRFCPSCRTLPTGCNKRERTRCSLWRATYCTTRIFVCASGCWCG